MNTRYLSQSLSRLAAHGSTYSVIMPQIAGRGSMTIISFVTPRSHNGDPQYCPLSAENQVPKNPQQILAFCTFRASRPPPSNRGAAEAISMPLHRTHTNVPINVVKLQRITTLCLFLHTRLTAQASLLQRQDSCAVKTCRPP